MIVTCPGCGSKYRVRDEAVPSGGAELKCPSCGAVFVAHPPKHSEEEIASAVDRITKAKEAAEQRVAELERDRGDVERVVADADRRAHEAEARIQQLEAQIIVLRSELAGVQNDARAQRQPLDVEIQRLRDENGRLMVRANTGQDAELRVLQLTEEVARARAAADHHPEVDRLNHELLDAQKTTGRLYTELENERQNTARIDAELVQLKLSRPPGAGNNNGDSSRTAELQVEVQRLKDELARAPSSSSGNGAPVPANVAALVAAMGPMLWGLEQAIKYLEPFGAGEAQLQAHVKQLQLLEKVLQRLTKEGAS